MRTISSPWLVTKLRVTSACSVLMLSSAISGARAVAQVITPAPFEREASTGIDSDGAPWVDRMQEGLHGLVWRTAMRVDRIAGSTYGEAAYQEASGSLAVAMLWGEHDGWDPKVRFRVDAPLPRLNERYRLFLGRLDPEEYVSERRLPSGALPRQRSRMNEDETLAGIVYSQPPRKGGRFSASAGARVRSPLDPYVKASYRYETPAWGGSHFRIRETVFWRNSEGLGLTSRLELDREFGPQWYVQWAGSGTISEKSEGIRGYSTFTIMHFPSEHRSISVRFLLEGETDAPVPLRDVGVQVAYRRSIVREWLVLEVRTDLTWPKDFPGQPRKPSWGLGLGLEMFFGDGEVSMKPVTF